MSVVFQFNVIPQRIRTCFTVIATCIEEGCELEDKAKVVASD